MRTERAQVAIVGAGPAGLLLGRLLHRAGIAAVILETRSREHCESRIRAGLLEQGTVDVLREAGVGERLHREGLVHRGIHLNVGGNRHHIPITELTGGRTVTVYGQTEIVKDLIAAHLSDGPPLRFEVTDVTLHDLETPRLTYRHDGAEHELRADLVAGCDGFHGICRAAIPAGALTVREREYPFAWLGILADVAPSTDELIYAHHPDGFALHSMRSPTVSRFYIQVHPGDELDAWPHERVWEALHRRLGCEGWTLQEGPVTDISITPMRSFVAAPMRHAALLLAGDAAHIVPPTGAKGLNLAVADVTRLADAIVAALRTGDRAGLDAYSDQCLERVWRAQHFSWWMTTMLHTDPSADDYERELQRSQLEYVFSSDAAARTLAENYAGLPLRAPSTRCWPVVDREQPRRIYDPVADTPDTYVRDSPGDHPPLDHPPYKSTARRHPQQPLVYLPHTISEITGPALGPERVTGPGDADLTRQHAGEPIGERIIVSGRVLDTEGKPLRDTLVEIWQANAAGRYRHRWDRWPAPLDPNFSGAGRCVTDTDGRYAFTTIKPGPYPWGNHHNAWRPAHIHFSLLGRAFTQRLVTQMYFPGDPFFDYDPIFNSVRDADARARMVSRFDIHATQPDWAAAYAFDVYLRGPAATPIEESH